MPYNRKTKDSGEHEDVHVNVPLPMNLHRRLKVKAANKDLTIKDALVAAVREYVRGVR